MKEITVAVIGSGSTYCPGACGRIHKGSVLAQAQEDILYGIDERKRTIVGNLCLRMLKKAGIECETLLSPITLTRLLQGADFVVTR